METINLKKIIDLKKFLTNIMNKINEKAINRNRKLSFKDTVFYSSYKIGNNYSYELINSHLKSINIVRTTRQALAKKEKNY